MTTAHMTANQRAAETREERHARLHPSGGYPTVGVLEMARRYAESLADYTSALHVGGRDEMTQHRRAYLRRTEALRRLVWALQRQASVTS